MKKKLLVLLLVSSAAFAGESGPDDLFALLQQESDLATKTKKNIDYLPGLITVLHRSELQRYGFKTVKDALELIPGIDFSMKGLIVRGIGNAFISGKTKIMLNGVTFNDTASSSAPYILRLPVEAVERVEVIRGPGSALYGEYAYSGVINIVTVSDMNYLFAGYEDYGHDHDGRHGGFAAFHRDSDLAMQLIVTDSASDGRYTDVKTDILYQPQFSGNIPVSNAPGSAELLSEQRFYLFDLQYKKFALSAYAVHSSEGAGFGEGNALPSDDGKANIEVWRKSFEARQTVELDGGAELRLKAGLLLSELRVRDMYVMPEGFTYIIPFDDGIIAGSHAKEEKQYGGAELAYEALQGHKLLVGAESSRSEIKDSYIERNVNPGIPTPLGSVQRFSGIYGPLGGHPTRSVRALYAQDEWSAGERTTVTLGLRYDDYDDIGSNTSPRIAAVYEISPVHILKAQYAHAFRPPNYIELYMRNNPFATGDETLTAETVDTYEAAYVFNNQSEVIRIGLFYSLLQNLIGIEKTTVLNGNYTDKGEATVRGVEAEFEKRYFDETAIRAHLSYVNAQNDDRTIDRYAALTGTLGVSKYLNKTFGTALLYRYTGEREREEADDRGALEAEHRIDLTLFNDHSGIKNLNLKGGIKNILDAPTAYPAPTGTYEDDYPRAGRNYWVKAEYGF